MLQHPRFVPKRVAMIYSYVSTDWYARHVLPRLRKSNPERAHAMALMMLRVADHRVGRKLLRYLSRVQDSSRLGTSVAGLSFRNPIGLAAGFDKNAEAVRAAAALGFGHIEAGSVTRFAQAGNPAPRMFRLPEDRAVINRLGMPSQGADSVRARLSCTQRQSSEFILGLNIGKMKNTSPQDAAREYAETFAILRGLADYYVINVSSPNTKGLRDLQHGVLLSEILRAVQEENILASPLFLKVAPDLTEDELGEIVRIATEHSLSGFVATNSTIDRTGLRSSVREEGGLSGEPLLKRAQEVVRILYRLTKGAVPIIGLGGVSSGKDVYDFICSGASLVQLYTAMVYQGPFIIARYLGEVEQLLVADGFKSVSDAVGCRAERANPLK